MYTRYVRNEKLSSYTKRATSHTSNTPTVERLNISPFGA